uniref:Uncharacterized protein TCIL3000_8_1290 n=1 Tax=Trypanosoma congolense (strain IL3000) TaxID=1068625 RepID=G0URA2_TRYCI|nr:unnamed protein product [Trypanosoma congolense IL3000]
MDPSKTVRDLMDILRRVNQEIPPELYALANRPGGGGNSGRRGGYGGRRGGGGFGRPVMHYGAPGRMSAPVYGHDPRGVSPRFQPHMDAGGVAGASGGCWMGGATNPQSRPPYHPVYGGNKRTRESPSGLYSDPHRRPPEGGHH